jgi:hypothetical protein
MLTLKQSQPIMTLVMFSILIGIKAAETIVATARLMINLYMEGSRCNQPGQLIYSAIVQFNPLPALRKKLVPDITQSRCNAYFYAKGTLCTAPPGYCSR